MDSRRCETVLTMTWVVEWLDGQSQEFFDLQEIGGQYYAMKREFLEKLRVLTKRLPNYHLRIGGLRSVKGTKGAANAAFLLILTTSAGLAVTFLGDITEEGAGRIIGVWPPQFRAVLEADEDAIVNLLYIVAERPEVVEHLELVF